MKIGVQIEKRSDLTVYKNVTCYGKRIMNNYE